MSTEFNKNMFRLLMLSVLSLFSAEATQDVLYPSYYRRFKNNPELTSVKLYKPFKIYSQDYDTIHISYYGVISFNDDAIKRVEYIDAESTYIALYSLAFLHPGYEEILYEEIVHDGDVLEMATKDVRLLNKDNSFRAKHAFVVTYSNVTYKHEAVYEYYTFQAVLASDDNVTYLIMNYAELPDVQATNGMSVKSCDAWVFRSITSSINLKKTSNIGINGRHAYELDGECKEQFTTYYPYGKEFGDYEINKNVLSQEVNLSRSVSLSSTVTIDKLFILDFGVISIYNISTPASLWDNNDFVIIALPISNANLSLNGSAVYYRETQDKGLLERASNDVNRFHGLTDFTAESMLVITYLNVRSLSRENQPNTFQIVLIWNSTNTYLLLNYIMVKQYYTNLGYRMPCDWNWIKSSIKYYYMSDESNTGIRGQFFYTLTPNRCYGEILYFYNVNIIAGTSTYQDTIISIPPLANTVNFFGNHERQLMYSTDGIVAMETAAFLRDYYDRAVIIPYGLKYIYYQSLYHYGTFTGELTETFYKYYLRIIDKDVQKINPNFTSTYAVMFTSINLPGGKEISTAVPSNERNTFQLVVITDNIDTYVILNYHKLETPGAIIGYSDAYCQPQVFLDLEDSTDAQEGSNVGIQGRYVFDMKQLTTCTRDLFPSGIPYGDTVINVDLNTPATEVQLTHQLPLTQINVNRIFIHPNGFITANNKYLYNELSLPANYTVFSPFQVMREEVNLGQIYYRETTNTSLLKQIYSETQSANYGIVVTFHTGNQNYENKFQVILLTDGIRSFVYFKYIDVHKNSPVGSSVFAESRCKYFHVKDADKGFSLQSNIERKGEFLYQINDVKECSVPDFYPYNQKALNYQVKLPMRKYSGFSINVYKLLSFSRFSDNLAIFTDGYITFNQTYADAVYAQTSIAMFGDTYWTDNYQKYALNGHIYVGARFSKEDLEIMSHTIRLHGHKDFTATRALLITYYNFYFDFKPLDRDMYQLALVTDEFLIYAIRNYVSVHNRKGLYGSQEKACNNTFFENSMSWDSIQKMWNDPKLECPGRIVELLTDLRCKEILLPETKTSTQQPPSTTAGLTATRTTTATVRTATTSNNLETNSDKTKGGFVSVVMIGVGGFVLLIVVIAIIVAFAKRRINTTTNEGHNEE